MSASEHERRIAEIRKRADDEWDKSLIWGARAAFGVIGQQALLVFVLYVAPRLYPVVPGVSFLILLYVFVRFMWHLERSAHWRRQAPPAAYRRLHPVIRFQADWPVPVIVGGIVLLSLIAIEVVNLSGGWTGK